MRVMLWCDMEGIAGISVWEQVNGGAALYEEEISARELDGDEAQEKWSRGPSATGYGCRIGDEGSGKDYRDKRSSFDCPEGRATSPFLGRNHCGESKADRSAPL